MYYSPSQPDIAAVRQQEKDVFIKIDLLNRDFKILESLQGNLISDNLNCHSSSKQRRSYTCDLHVSDASFLLGASRKIWIDKYIRVYYGIKLRRSGEIRWWLIGTFSYINADYRYSSTDNTLSLSCADLMADYDGTKNGQMDGYSLTIPAGEDIRASILGTLKKAGITRYAVEDIQREIPYDLNFQDATTYCDIWTKLCELYDSWEFYFDINGTFIWRQIPTGLSEPVIFDDTFLDPLWIDESINHSFSGIYNVTEVWGKVFELSLQDRYAETSTILNGVYGIMLDGITSLDQINHLDQIAIKICVGNTAGAKVSINGLEPIPIVKDDGAPLEVGRLSADTTYVFSYRRNMGKQLQNCLYLLGQYQAHGIYRETNPECPFSVDNLGYEIVNRVNYDDLYSDDLCYNQAEYLTYQSTAMFDTVTLNLLLIPWLDVNQKIQYTSKTAGKTSQYIIKDFSWSTLDGTMSITLYRFLESFSYVKNKEQSTKGRNA